MKKASRHWKMIYAVCCLLYVGWVLHAGNNEFDRINSQYRSLNRQLEPDHIMAATLDELAAECRKKMSRQLRPLQDDCSEHPPAVVEAKRSAIAERQKQARERGLIKVVLFYAGFVTIFLLSPVVLVYLLIIAVIALYKNIRIVR